MKLTDKRFWKFEAFTFLYAIGLILLVGLLFDKPIQFEKNCIFFIVISFYPGWLLGWLQMVNIGLYSVLFMKSYL